MEQGTIEIPRDRWREYLVGVAGTHSGWRLSIEAMSTEIGDQWAADGMGLIDCRFETDGADAGRVCIEAGDRATAVLIHQIQRPVRLRAAEVVAGNELDILIESEAGMQTLVTLRRRPALPVGAVEGDDAAPRAVVAPRGVGAFARSRGGSKG